MTSWRTKYAGLGLAILRAPSYRPALGDTVMHFDPFGARADQARSRGSWWTGNR
jgi:hypothetical protein